MVRARLGGRVGGIGPIGAVLAEQTLGAERAEHFVGRNMEEAEGLARFALQLAPIGERLRQKDEGAHHIGLDERGGAVDRAIDVAFGGQMQDGFGTKSLERRLDRVAVANIGAQKGIARTVRRRRERSEIAGVGKLVQHEHVVVHLADRLAHDRRADEPRAAGNQQPHRKFRWAINRNSLCLGARPSRPAHDAPTPPRSQAAALA